MIINDKQKQKLRKLYKDMTDSYNESDDITDARAYKLYLEGMEDTLLVFGLTIEDIKK